VVVVNLELQTLVVAVAVELNKQRAAQVEQVVLV
jgi:hypothetical protein